MSLQDIDCRMPVVKFDLVTSPPNVTARVLEDRLMFFEYLDEPRRRPTMTFAFDNSDGRIVNEAMLAVGLQMHISFGYEGLHSRPFLVTISKVKAAPVRSPSTVSPAPGSWGIITMEGVPQPPKVHWRPENDVGTFRNMKIADVVRQIARNQGYAEKKVFVQDGIAISGQPDAIYEEFQICEDETSYEFLVRLSREIGFEFTISKGEFHFHQANWKSFDIETIEYFAGPDLLDFTIEGDYNMSLRKVSARAINPKTRTLHSNVAVPTGVSGMRVLEVLDKHDVMTAAMPAKLMPAAARRLVTNATSRWFIRLVLIGNARVLRGTSLNLQNFGPFIDGPWTVQSARHTIDNMGYTTNLGLRRIAAGKAASCKYLHMKVPIRNAQGEVTGQSSRVANVTTAPTRMAKKGRMRNLRPGKNDRSYRQGNVQYRVANEARRWNAHTHPASAR